MIKYIRKHGPIVIALALFFVLTSLCLVLSVDLNEGHLVYTHDDAYIHMAMAKNFSQHGVWGVTSYQFSSSSSSPLWTLLLSLIYYLFGASSVAPFVLNIIIAVAVLVTAYIILKRYEISPGFIYVAVPSLLFFVPVVPLVFSGMEHLLHLLITLIVIYLSTKLLCTKNGQCATASVLLLLAPLLVMIRYEGLYLAFVVTGLLFLRRRFFYALAFGVLSVLPVIVYGLISKAKGWYFLPNSVLLKGTIPNLSTITGILLFLGYGAYLRLIYNWHLLFLFISVLIIFIVQYRRSDYFWAESKVIPVIVLAVMFLQLQFSGLDFVSGLGGVGIGGLYRYWGYIIGIALIGLFVGAHDLYGPPLRLSFNRFPKYLAFSVLMVILFLPLVKRGVHSLYITPRATHNIYEQQYQMGLFLKEYYDGRTVAANDIGAICYLADIKLVDLVGLANMEVARSKATKCYNKEQIRQIAANEGVTTAIVYEEWFAPYGGLPREWKKLGRWGIVDNVICGGSVVSFYAVDTAEQDELVKNIEAFSRLLPEGVYAQVRRALPDVK